MECKRPDLKPTSSYQSGCRCERCKTGHAQVRNLWRTLNPEKANAIHRRWCYKNRARVLEWKREWSKQNPDKVKNTQLQIRFGISLVEYRLMLERQNFLCAICKRPQSEFNKQFAVDHDHVTKTVRALLCMDCNTALGKFRDNVWNVRQAVEYLTRWKEVKEAA